MAPPNIDKKSQADALGQLASHGSDSTHSIPDMVAAAKAPTTAKAAAMASASQTTQSEPPKTVAEARAKSQRGLELLTNVIHVLEDASRTITLSGKHTRSAIDNAFKMSYTKLVTAAENIQRSSDSIAATNNRMAAALKTLKTAGGVDPRDLAEIQGQLVAISEMLSAAPRPAEAPNFQAFTESLQQLKAAVENASRAPDDQAAQTAVQTSKDVKEFAKTIEQRTGKLTTLVVVAMASSIFAALCAFAAVLAMLLK